MKKKKKKEKNKKTKATILQCSAFFMVQLSHFYMTTGKPTALTIWTFVSKVMSLLFNTLSRSVITFLPRSKNLSIVASVTICSDFRAQENKIYHCFHCFLIYLPWSDWTEYHDLRVFFLLLLLLFWFGFGFLILVFWMFSFKTAF